MKLEHSFTVPADLETVWQAVLDPERVAPCMPGAALTEVEGDAFKGSVKVKLGPISLLYKGSGEFLEKDEQSRKVVIKAAGKDARGNGTASAKVTVTLTPNGDSTTGTVETDLSITGKPAQFGRGLISEVGGKILDTFATCLASKLAPDETPAPNLSVVKEKAETPPKNTKPKSKPTSTNAASPAAATNPPADSPNTSAAPTSTPTNSTNTRATSTSAPTDSASASTDSTNTPAGSTSSPTAPTSSPTGRTSTSASSTSSPASSTSTSTDSAVASAATSMASSAAAARAEASETGHKAGEATAAHAPAPTKPKLAAAPEPETEPIDLLSYAGPSVLKRAAPLLALVVAVLVFIALRRRR